MRTALRQTLTGTRQHGAALLVMLVILITGGVYLLVSQLNRESGRIEAEKKTVAALAQAKEALIGWAVGNLSTPGMLPYSDRRNDGDYNGMSDCPAAGTSTSAGLLLGKIPRIGPEAPCLQPRNALGGLLPYPMLNLDVVDGAGEVLWYAVSKNMVSELGVAPVINPGMINNPVFPWLTVRDQNGNTLSNRVAFLLIAPGLPLSGQNRSGAAPTPAQFLEGIGAVTNADSDGSYDGGIPACPSSMCEDFVMSEPWPSATTPTFNDRLLYVTIDELMPLIEQRVAREVRQTLLGLASFPSAAAIGYIGNSCGNTNGFLPLPSCECTRTVTALGDSVSCDCPFDSAAATPALITYSYTGIGNYTAPATGACTIPTATSCRCTGAGSCSSPTRSFQCYADGTCAARNNIATPNFNITYTLPSSVTGIFSDVTKNPIGLPNCTSSPTTMSCSNFTYAQGTVGCAPAQLLTGLPGWFLSSRWKHYMYYAAAPPLLTVGNTGGVTAVLITTGAPLTGQTRPSSNRNNYLDSPENRDGPPVFTGVGQPLTNTFNDQAVIVAP